MPSPCLYTLISPSFFLASRVTMDRHHDYDCRLGLAHTSLCCITKGRLTLEAGGRVISAQAGDAVYFPRQRRYVSHWDGEPEIEFYGLYLDWQTRIVNQQAVSRQPEPPDSFYFQALSGQSVDYVSLFTRVYENYHSPENNLLALSGCLSVYDLMRRRMVREPARPDWDSMETALNLLTEQCAENIPVADIARACGMSESQFYHRFRQATGFSPIEYKNRERIRRAIDLLSGESFSVERIADMLGFSSPAYFRRIFKKVTGGAPGDFRGGRVTL